MVLKRNSQKLKAQPSGISGNETYEMSNFNMAIILCYVGNFYFIQFPKFYSEITVYHMMRKKQNMGQIESFRVYF